MLPHIYHGFTPSHQQEIIKAKIDHYSYSKDGGYFNKPLNNSTTRTTTTIHNNHNYNNHNHKYNNHSASMNDGGEVGGGVGHYTVKSFDPKENTTHTCITMNHLKSHRVEVNNELLNSIADKTSRFIKSEQSSIRPNSNQFINKKLTETTNGDYRPYESVDFPKRVTAQQVEYRKGSQQTDKTEYQSTSISHRNRDEIVKPKPYISYTPKNHLVKSKISEDFKPSTITKCPPAKLALTQPDCKTYPKPECGLDGQPSSYSKDFTMKNDFLSSTSDIEGVHPHSKLYRNVGYSGYVPDENHTSFYGKTLNSTQSYTFNNGGSSNGLDSSNKFNNSLPSEKKLNSVAFSSTNGMNANQSLYKNNGSLKPSRCTTFQSSNYGSDHLPGYSGFISTSLVTRDSANKQPQTPDYQLANTMKRASSIENPNVTREDYMKGWKNDSQLQTVFGGNKDKSYFRNNAMIREFYTYNY